MTRRRFFGALAAGVAACAAPQALFGKSVEVVNQAEPIRGIRQSANGSCLQFTRDDPADAQAKWQPFVQLVDEQVNHEEMCQTLDQLRHCLNDINAPTFA